MTLAANRRRHGWHLGGLALVGAVTISLSACSIPRPAMPVGGALEVMDPDHRFIEAISNSEVPDSWIVSGTHEPGTLSIKQVDRTTALSIASSNTAFAFVRKVNASLLATPYLSWAWHVQPPSHGAHPVSILVELTNREAPSTRPWWKFTSSDIGDANRLILLVWHETALGRGTIIGPIKSEGHPQTARYIARGGPEQANRWWVDTVDLSLIHRQIWPNDDQAKYDIRYIGISVQATGKPQRSGDGGAGNRPGMNLAELRLTR